MKSILSVSIIFIIMNFYSSTAQSNLEPITLKYVISAGLENNYHIKLKKKEVAISQGQMLANKGRLNPYFDLKLESNFGDDPTITHSDYYDALGTFVVPTDWGINVFSGFDLLKQRTLEPTMDENIGGVFVGLDIPLLQGLGTNNAATAYYDAAKLQHESETIAFSHEITVFIREAALSYMALLQATSVYSILQQMLRNVSDYRDNIKLLIEKQQIPKSESYRAEAFYNNTVLQLSDAEKSVQTAYYDLYKTLGIVKIPDGALGVSRFSDKYPDFDKLDIDDYTSKLSINLDTIIKKRLDYQSRQLKIAGIARELDAAGNQILHDLNLNVTFNYFGFHTGSDPSKFFSGLTGKFPGPSLDMKLTYRFPFQNDVNEGNYLAKLSQYESENVGLDQLFFEMKNRLENYIVGLKNAYNLYKLQVTNVDLYHETYLNEYEKFKLGTATQIDVINSYSDYLEKAIALESYKAAIGINITVIKYLTGELPSNSRQIDSFDLWMLN